MLYPKKLLDKFMDKYLHYEPKQYRTGHNPLLFVAMIYLAGDMLISNFSDNKNQIKIDTKHQTIDSVIISDKQYNDDSLYARINIYK